MSKMLKANKENLDKKQRKRNKDKIIKNFPYRFTEERRP